MNLFLKLVASLPILIYFIIIRPTVQIESWDFEPESDRFLNTMMGMGDKIKDAFTKPTLNLTKPTSGGLDGDKDKPDFANVENSAYNFLTSFVNQTRSTIPLIAHHGNFTLIQAALLFTIGCMAAGAATIVLEGLAFRQRETEIELYKVLTAHHSDPHSGAYGPPSPSPVYGAAYGHNQRQDDNSYDSVPSSEPNFYSEPSSYNSDPLTSYYGSSSSTARKKRDTGQDFSDGRFLQLSQPYRRNVYSRPGSGFRQRHQQNSGGLTGNRNQNPIAFAGAGSASTSQQLSGYPDSNNFLMLNRLGMKRKHYGSQKRRVQNDDDDEMEYARGIPVELETETRRPHRQRKHKISHDREREREEELNGYNIKGEDGIVFDIPNISMRKRQYWKNLLARTNLNGD